MPAFFLNAKTQHENLGDAVITRQLIALARQHGPVSVQVVGLPEHFRKTLDLKSHEVVQSPLSFWFNLLRARLLHRVNGQRFSGSVFYLLNPGGFEGEFSAVQTLRQLALIVAYGLLRCMGIRIMRVGCSLGPFGSRRLFIERLKSRLLTRVSARDPISIEYARVQGLGEADYFPDLAFLLSPPVQAREVHAAPVLGISFRDGKGGTKYNERIGAILGQVIETAPSGARFIAVTQVGFDHARNTAIMDSLGLASRGEHKDVASDMDAAAGVYRGIDVVFSNRLHVLLLALRQGAKVVALLDRKQNRKIVGILELIGFQNCIWDINDETPRSFEQAMTGDTRQSEVVFEEQARIANDLFARWVKAP